MRLAGIAAALFIVAVALLNGLWGQGAGGQFVGPIDQGDSVGARSVGVASAVLSSPSEINSAHETSPQSNGNESSGIAKGDTSAPSWFVQQRVSALQQRWQRALVNGDDSELFDIAREMTKDGSASILGLFASAMTEALTADDLRAVDALNRALSDLPTTASIEPLVDLIAELSGESEIPGADTQRETLLDALTKQDGDRRYFMYFLNHQFENGIEIAPDVLTRFPQAWDALAEVSFQHGDYAQLELYLEIMEDEFIASPEAAIPHLAAAHSYGDYSRELVADRLTRRVGPAVDATHVDALVSHLMTDTSAEQARFVAEALVLFPPVSAESRASLGKLIDSDRAQSFDSRTMALINEAVLR